MGQSSSSQGQSFVLLGGDRSDLQKWVNSRVEIRGSIDSSGIGGGSGSGSMGSGSMSSGTTGSGSTGSGTTGSGTTGSGTTGSGTTGSGTTGSGTSGSGTTGGTSAGGTSAGQSGSMSNMGAVQTLRVTSARKVSGSCNGGDR